ncbi:MAG: ferrous iron transport protein B [Oscillospiraceae bacterium]|jgi:ferrous iron transport protein B|nr:ferrous iron transport protein B [Oscillospiraceae bacterium]
MTRLALVGNQNCGKTTLFNRLTGGRQPTGNWPGVTVEKKEGPVKGAFNAHLVDLPGLYSLSPYTPEEQVSRDFLTGGGADCVIDVVDASNLERNLYLTLQLLELGRPMVVALNMTDAARAAGQTVDAAGLSRALGVPVVPISARGGAGVDRLLRQAARAAREGPPPPPVFASEPIRDELPAETRDELLADARYRVIEALMARHVRRTRPPDAAALSPKIDRVVTHRLLAFPIFGGVMALVFFTAFGPAGVLLNDAFAVLLTRSARLADGGLRALNVADWLRALLLDGVWAGVGGVLRFLPVVLLLFFCLSLLEDSGYLARAAFVMDKPLRRVGLSGRSFIPLLMGFGCTVPAAMAARALTGDRDRRLTVALIPFMSCGAKVPVYSLFATAFFPRAQGLVMATLYLLGVLAALLTGLALKKTLYLGQAAPFLMELPAYRFPSLPNVARLVWDKAREFVRRAFTVIFCATVLVWFLQSFGPDLRPTDNNADSLLARLGSLLAPLFEPLGFGTWQAAAALLTGVLAKESVVSTLSVLYGGGPDTLTALLPGLFTPPAAWAFMVFTLLYTPCVAAVAAMRREMGLPHALGALVTQTGLAWLAACLVFQLGRRLG